MVLEDLAYIESKLQELIQGGCCQYDITQADIDEGTFTITEPGIYCLTEDIIFTGAGNAVTINNTQPEVFLNLKGHAIIGYGTGVGIFITNTVYGTMIYNGTISGCQTGIYLVEATQVETLKISIGTELLGNSAQSNVVYGIQDQGSSNLIYLTNDPSSLNVQVIDCVLSKNKDFGIYAEAENTVIKECSVVGRDIGIYISSLANNAHILSNYVSNNGTSGIVNDSVTSYIWGNNGSKNGTNCSGAVAPINMLVSLAAQYWANVEN